MKEKKRIRFPVLLKVIFLGVITSFVASTVAIIVNYNNMINNAIKDLDNSANEALEFANDYFVRPGDRTQNLDSFEAVQKYVTDIYVDNTNVKEAELYTSEYPTFDDFEYLFYSTFPYFYADGMFMTRDYPEWYQSYIRINQILLAASSYSDQNAFFAFKDPNDDSRFVFLCDSRLQTTKQKGVYYHCPGSHYTLKDTDEIIDIGHDYIKGYKLSSYNTRFVEIRRTDTDENKPLGYIFIEYETSKVAESYRPILINEILILSATAIVVIVLYAIVSYLMFVRNINKLNKAAVGISTQLGSNQPFEIVDPSINSNDEISTLSNSFVAMEREILNYVEIIKRDATEKEKINAELEIANKIQIESLPSASFDSNDISIKSFIKPAKEVGGDFYDYFSLSENEMAVIISDVSGKGIPASLFMMKSKELIKSRLLSGLDLETAIKQVNDILCENNEESLFVTSFVGVIDFKKKEIRYVNAGHEKPYIISNKKVIKLDGTSNFVLGGVDGLTYKEEKHSFRKGDMIFMFTDGLNESINDDEEEFSYQRIEENLKKSLGSSLEEIISNMKDELDSFVGDKEAFDDITMLIAKFNENSLTLSYDKKDVSIIEETQNKFEEVFSYLEPERKAKVGIVIDELINNLVSYEKREDLKIDIRFAFNSGILKVEIISNGDDYNPFENNRKKYLDNFSHDIEEGGFGITLVQEMSKSVKYKYKDGHSYLTIEI